jgi:hypothetical protein
LGFVVSVLTLLLLATAMPNTTGKRLKAQLYEYISRTSEFSLTIYVGHLFILYAINTVYLEFISPILDVPWWISIGMAAVFVGLIQSGIFVWKHCFGSKFSLEWIIVNMPPK